MTFLDMLRDATARNDSTAVRGPDPEPTRFLTNCAGDAHRIYDFCAAIDATADLVCAFAADRLLCRARRRAPASSSA